MGMFGYLTAFQEMMNQVKQIQWNPGNLNSDNSNSPTNSNLIPFPLDLTPLFSHLTRLT